MGHRFATQSCESKAFAPPSDSFCSFFGNETKDIDSGASSFSDDSIFPDYLDSWDMMPRSWPDLDSDEKTLHISGCLVQQQADELYSVPLLYTTGTSSYCGLSPSTLSSGSDSSSWEPDKARTWPIAGVGSPRGKSAKPRSGPKDALTRKFTCDYSGCAKKFTRMADLLRHTKHVHFDERKKLNIVCDYSECARHKQPFSRKDHYREHLRETHGEDMTKRGINVYQPLPPSKPSAPGKRDEADQEPPTGLVEEPLDGCDLGRLEDLCRLMGGGPGCRLPTESECSPPFLSELGSDGASGQDGHASDPEEERLRSCRIDLGWWRCSPCLRRVARKPDKPQEDWKCLDCRAEIEPVRRKIREEAATRRTVADDLLLSAELTVADFGALLAEFDELSQDMGNCYHKADTM